MILDVGYNVNEPSPQVNQYTLDGSYTFNPGNYSGSVTLSGFIYSKSSGSTTSEQKGSLEYSNSYTLPFIQPSVSFTWTWGTVRRTTRFLPLFSSKLILEITGMLHQH